MQPPRLFSAQRCARLLALLLFAGLSACGGGGGGGGSPPPPPAPAVPPSISAQAQDLSVVDGAAATFAVTASGSTPLSYQWQRNGSNIVGATEARYTIASALLTDSGSRFQVVVTGPGGSITSNTATLTVTPIALTIATQPASQTVPDGTAASFSIQASGSAPISYQWLRNGEAIAGATEASYTTPVLSLQDHETRIQVQVTNPAGTLPSTVAVVGVSAVAPSIKQQPASLTGADGATLNLAVTATGSAPLRYQWSRNGTPITGATEATLSLTARYPDSGDRYTVSISNQAGSLQSEPAVITVNPLAAAFSAQPQGATITTGGSARFSVAVASGTPPLSYQWQRSMDGGASWAAVNGANLNSYSLSNATLADAGARFRVAVTNPAATVYSEVALVAVQPQVRVLAGIQGGEGYAEGRGSAARFNFPFGVAAAANGDLFVADTNNYVIRRVSPDGQTRLYAGKPGKIGMVNGPIDTALLQPPNHLAIDSQGTLYFSEYCSIRKITPDGVVSDFAGPGRNGCKPADGQGIEAGFSSIVAMATDGAGNLYVADGHESQTLRKITPDGRVSTLAGSFGKLGYLDGVGANARFGSLGSGLAVDESGHLFVSDGTTIRRVSSAGVVSLYAGKPETQGVTEGDRLTEARFSGPRGLAFDRNGHLFVSDQSRIVRIGTDGKALIAAGSYSSFDQADIAPSSDGVGGSARVGAAAITRLADGNLGFVEYNSNTVRVLNPALGRVATLAGMNGPRGWRDGPASTARFFDPSEIVAEPGGSLLVLDPSNQRLRRIAVDGTVTTVAGGLWGGDDGQGTTARMAWPQALARDTAGNVYIADTSNHTIRKMTPAGFVSTLAGKAGEAGSRDGNGVEARFQGPRGIAVDASGNVYVADTGNYLLRRIAPDGRVSTVAGNAGTCCNPVDGQGDQARFGWPSGLAVDAQGNVYVADEISHAIRRVTPQGQVSTIAGALNSPGHNDDQHPYARLNSPRSLALDANGNLYVADYSNGVIRRITPGGFVSTVVGVPGQAVLGTGTGAPINKPRGVAVRPGGRLVFTSEQAVVGD